MKKAIRFTAIMLSMLCGAATAKAAETAYDYCAPQNGSRVTLMLVDRSAAYTEEDVRRFYRGLDRVLKQQTQAGDRLVIRSVRNVSSASDVVFARCLPTCPAKLGFLESCDEDKVAQDRRNYQAELTEKLAPDILMAPLRINAETALAETIDSDVRQGPRPQRLVIFSDFLEYHGAGGGLPKVNFYQKMTAAQADSYIQFLHATQHLADLRGISVEAYGFGQELGGATQLSGRRPLTDYVLTSVSQFWTSYFQAAGAQPGFVLNLEYGGGMTPELSMGRADDRRATQTDKESDKKTR